MNKVDEYIEVPDFEINKIYCCDCVEFMRQLPNECVDLIITDPPQLVTKEMWDKIEVFDEKIIGECLRVLKNTGSIYVWCGIGERNRSFIRWFLLLDKHFYFKDLIIWKKQRGSGARKGWLFTREEIIWFVKDNSKYFWNESEQYSQEKRKVKGYYLDGKSMDERAKSPYKRWTNVWVDIIHPLFRTPDKRSLSHSSTKPLEAIERIIKLHTKSGSDLILDPFMGSGTTAIAAKRLGRNFIGCEINPEYVELANKRLEDDQ